MHYSQKGKRHLKNRTILVLLYTLALSLVIGFSFLPSGLRIYGKTLALFIPLAIGVGVFVKKNGTKPVMYEGDGEKALPYLFFAPVLLLIILISLLTTFAFSLVGLTSSSVAKLPFGEALVMYALLPAVLEEAFYRVLPALALNEEEAGSVCIFSTLIFAFAHLSVFSLPYALFGGLTFFALNRIAKSPLPSVLLHLLNNLISLLFLYSSHYELTFAITLVALLLLSVVSFVLMAKHYRESVRALLEELRASRRYFRFTPDLVAYLVLTAILTIVFI